jgi:hypothetical protein
MRTLILAAALVAGPMAAAHELDSEQPLTREQIEHVKGFAKDLRATSSDDRSEKPEGSAGARPTAS